MTNDLALAVDYLRRARLRVRAVEALIDAGDFPDAVRESQESVELAQGPYLSAGSRCCANASRRFYPWPAADGR
jgi:hypothetical protein